MSSTHPDTTSKAGTILSRARRQGRGSKLQEMIAQGLESDDDQIAQYFGEVAGAGVAKTKKPTSTTRTKHDDDDEKAKQKQTSSSLKEDENNKKSDHDEDEDEDEEDDDSTFSDSDISHISKDTLDSDFGYDEDDSDEYDSDADEIVDDKAIRREERAEARKERERMEKVVTGGNKNSKNSKKSTKSAAGDETSALAAKRLKMTTTQEQRMQTAFKWAEKQTEILQQKEALYNDAERIVKERAMLAITRRRRRTSNATGEEVLDDKLGPPRPVYFSSNKLLEQTDGKVACVVVYPTNYDFCCKPTSTTSTTTTTADQQQSEQKENASSNNNTMMMMMM